MSELLKTTKDRWNSDTPPFFEKIRKWASIIALASGVLAAGITSVITAGIAVPVWIPVILGAITAMSTTAAATSKLTTTDKNIMERQYQEGDK